MAQSYSFQAEECTDATALEAVLALHSLIVASGHYQLLVRVFHAEHTHQLWTQGADEVRRHYQAIVDADISAVESLRLSAHGHPGVDFTYTRVDSKVAVSWRQGDGVAAIKLVRDAFRAVTATTVRKQWSADQQNYVAQLELATSRLNDVARDALRESQAFRGGLEEDYRAKRHVLEGEMDARRRHFEAEFELREQALAAKEEALKLRTDELDNRDAVHARRQLRGDLQGEIRSRRDKPELSKGTANKRLIVHAIVAVGLLALGSLYLGYFQPNEAATSDVELWFSQVRRVVAGLGFGGLLWFWIRWTSQWFKENAQAEFRIRQLALDFDRASWLVEVTREWADAKVQPPQELIDAMARGLFESSDSTSEKHRLGELASHLERAERVRLKFGENELDLGKAALKARGQ